MKNKNHAAGNFLKNNKYNYQDFIEIIETEKKFNIIQNAKILSILHFFAMFSQIPK